MGDCLPGLDLRLTGPLYFSLDLDALDMAFAPGVSHHEPCLRRWCLVPVSDKSVNPVGALSSPWRGESERACSHPALSHSRQRG